MFNACFVRATDLGPEGGRTWAIKDTIDIAGYPTQSGSRAFAEAPAAGEHAAVVHSILTAGGRIVGKTTLHELAFGMTGINDWAGTAPNPAFPDLVPGGSSSGSAAAVAAGLVDFGLGTDTGGSVRMPAAHCGLFGLKPTHGRISRKGVAPAESSLDCVGPLAATMDGLITAMTMMDPTFRPEHPSSGVLRLGLPEVEANPVILAAIGRVLAASGAETTVVSLPSLEDAFAAGLTVINAENWRAFGAFADSGLLGPDVEARLKRAASTTPDALAEAEAIRARFTDEVDTALAGVDALALPTLPGFPMTVAEARAGKTDLRASLLIRPFNLSGHPALVLPLPPAGGKPVSLQLVGRKGGEAALCALGQRLATPLGL
ncbi:MAG: amidase [Rhodospirillum sp.]|nr:amidase [Rhodospirillum sp.]MCF8491050.1 amidase [Rhodospirillum sp.]MCF8500373.1 amidase [Rhodospirillum sp.]